jgi:hypothetical protein
MLHVCLLLPTASVVITPPLATRAQRCHQIAIGLPTLSNLGVGFCGLLRNEF